MVFYFKDLPGADKADVSILVIATFTVTLPFLIYSSQNNTTSYYIALIGASILAVLQIIAVGSNMKKYPL